MDRDDVPEEIERPQLRSLAQVARSNNLSSARRWMIIVGVLALLSGVAQFLLLQHQLSQLRAQGALQGNPVVDAEIVMAYAIIGGQTVMGIVFFVLAAMVTRYPVVATITGLVLFVGFQVVAMILDPVNILGGILLKIIVVVVLIKAIQAAVAYQREQALEASRMELADEYD